MTVKTEQLLSEITEALFAKKAVLLSGTSGVGKTYLAKQAIEQLKKIEYSCFPESEEQNVYVEIIPCHSSISYEDIVGGISVKSEDGSLAFRYEDKILVDTIVKAANDFRANKGTKYVVLLDDIQRTDLSVILGEVLNVLGSEGIINKLHLNAGTTVEVTPNFYVIATYNSIEGNLTSFPKELYRNFFTIEIIPDSAYVTNDPNSDNAILFDRVRTIIINNLDIQYKTGVYDQERFVIGHGFFAGNDLFLKVNSQVVPVLKQYIADGILDEAADNSIRHLKSLCSNKKRKQETKEETVFSDYRSSVTPVKFVNNDATSVPLENLIGRIIDQHLLSNDEITAELLFNTFICYREKNVDNVTYQAQLLANNIQYEKIRRGGSDGRRLYNAGTLKIDNKEYHFTGGMQPKEYTVRNPRRNMAIWDIEDKYEIGESTSPNVILFRIVWQYYKTLIKKYEQYLQANPMDSEKKKLLNYIKTEWIKFLYEFKQIKPLPSSDANIKAENNKEANKNVRELIAKLSVLWSDLGDVLIMSDGSEVVLEGVEIDMNNNIYKEYLDAMDLLGVKQMILQGPPGTSKTYSAKELIKYVANCDDTTLEDLQIEDYYQKNYCKKKSQDGKDPDVAWDIVQFHPSYGYEDFIRGIKVSTDEESQTVIYNTVNKILGNMAELAKEHEETRFFLIIDEINRANLATVFGELIYGLEYRSEMVATPYTVEGSNKIELPDNVYIIGTMNTADKSIGGIDYAIRRRFLFFEQLPDERVIQNYKTDKGNSQIDINTKACNLFKNVKKIFQDDYLSPEYRKEDVQIGHTYFLVDSEEMLKMKFEYQIIPILKEYFKDGIISFDVQFDNSGQDDIDGFEGLLNCIAGNINMTTQEKDVDTIFNALIS